MTSSKALAVGVVLLSVALMTAGDAAAHVQTKRISQRT